MAIMGTLPSTGAEITLYASGAPAAVQEVLAREFTRQTGHKVAITAATIDVIVERLRQHAPADVVVLPRKTMDELVQAGVLRAGTVVDLARVGVGVAVRQGAPVPDVSTPDALRTALLAASSIVHPDPQGGGFAGIQIARMLERLGIADTVRPKVVTMFAYAGGAAAVAKGDVEIGLFNMSEIVPVPGVVLAGPLPGELQSTITMAGALHADTTVPEPSAQYLRFVGAPAASAAWTNGGMEAVTHP